MSNLHFHHFDNDDILALTLANTIAKNLKDAILEKGSASLVVSGGSTPKKLFKALSKIDLSWENVRIGLCDERWVTPHHNDSNEKLVRENLMVNYAARAAFVGMFIDSLEVDQAETACSEKIKSSLWPFDVVVLGMGDDAHTASLFPHNPKLKEAYESNDLCIAIEPTTAPHLRMSLTLSAILSAQHLYLHFQGAKKIALYHEALSGKDTAKMPIRAILHQLTKEVEVYTA